MRGDGDFFVEFWVSQESAGGAVAFGQVGAGEVKVVQDFAEFFGVGDDGAEHVVESGGELVEIGFDFSGDAFGIFADGSGFGGEGSDVGDGGFSVFADGAEVGDDLAEVGFGFLGAENVVDVLEGAIESGDGGGDVGLAGGLTRSGIVDGLQGSGHEEFVEIIGDGGEAFGEITDLLRGFFDIGEEGRGDHAFHGPDDGTGNDGGTVGGQISGSWAFGDHEVNAGTSEGEGDGDLGGGGGGDDVIFLDFGDDVDALFGLADIDVFDGIDFSDLGPFHQDGDAAIDAAGGVETDFDGVGVGAEEFGQLSVEDDEYPEAPESQGHE